MSTVYATIETNPYRAALLAGAAACVNADTPEWWSMAVLPFEEVFAKIEPFSDDAAHLNESPEAAAMFLLLVSETLH
ncbi:MAG: hypothetical protein ABIQ82_06810 [Variovorax sp.]